ncbi:MAG: group II intron reverse transcriptase/maturase [Steroidobacteraceae bacterium]
MGNLATPDDIQKLQTALQAKAKGEPGFRFYSLYDKLYRADVLHHAYACCRANQGAAGVDGQRFEDIESYGVERWLGELADTLRKKTYQPQALKRVYVPKPNGKLRPLSIPTIRDRTAMTAATLILAPIFEADLPPEQHGYRPERSALSAVKETRELLVTGRTEVVDADLTDYFGSIPHAQLMRSVARRVVDRQILHLIKMWLETPVEESDDQGRTRRTTRNKDTKRGIPQGAPISPLLSNLYMRRLVLGWKQWGLERRFDARIVTYADDLVICCRHGAEEALAALRQLAGRLGLTVNEEKTGVCRMPEGRFDFLGYSFERCYSERTGRSYLGSRPSRKSIKRMIDAISAHTERRSLCLDAATMVERLNRSLYGWANYFCLGPVSKSYRAVNAHTIERLRQWLCNKHKISGNGRTRFPNQYLHEQLGLVYLPALTRNLPWAKA